MPLVLVGFLSSQCSAAGPVARGQGIGEWENIQLVPVANATQLQAVPCIAVSQAPGGPYAQLNLTSLSGVSAVIMTDVWNTRSGSGDVTVRACRTHVSAYVNVINATASNIYDTVMGYPEIMYGYKPWGQTVTGESPYLELPQAVGRLPPILAYLNYTLNFTNGRGDFSFDIWVTRSYEPSSVTVGDLEVMVWFYHTPGFNPMGYPSPNATFYVPTFINGTLVNATWQAYVARSIPWTYIAVVLSPPASSGSVEVPLTQLLGDVGQLYDKLWNYSFNDMYLNDVELGMEYTSLKWPPVDVNVTAWYRLYSFGFLVPLETTTTVTKVVTQTASPVTLTSTTTATTIITSVINSSATTTPAGRQEANSIYLAAAAAIVGIIVGIAVGLYLGSRRRAGR
ncbi:GH12 family glycosyl hydrolase domain-containing protein [Acidilobus sp.]|uniref:GH12 family glycosyl hydrolase domain-containing protein n=1 Tax=Acidilobus sp. TaxID=1872109 RepID=UPI003D016C99